VILVNHGCVDRLDERKALVQAIGIVASAWLFWVGSYNNKWVSNWLKVRVVL
jgi:site-specific recombinase XerC